MRGTVTIGEWIRGPFKSTDIEGFIMDITIDGWCEIKVKKIEDYGVPLPQGLSFGSTHKLPIYLIEEYYLRMNEEQQASQIMVARASGDEKWVRELVEKFYNPFNNISVKERVYSSVLKKTLDLEENARKKLYDFYQEAVAKGLTPRLGGPDDINTTEGLDIAIAYIVLVSKNEEGINFIRSLVKNK